MTPKLDLTGGEWVRLLFQRARKTGRTPVRRLFAIVGNNPFVSNTVGGIKPARFSKPFRPGRRAARVYVRKGRPSVVRTGENRRERRRNTACISARRYFRVSGSRHIIPYFARVFYSSFWVRNE